MTDLDEDMSGGSRCCFGLMALLVQILLHGELALTLYWIVQYRWDAVGLPFAFREGQGVELPPRPHRHTDDNLIYFCDSMKQNLYINLKLAYSTPGVK